MRVYVESFGCAQNQGEGSAIARDLALHGAGIAPSPADADAAVLVTCGVIGPTEARMVRRWHALSALVPRTVVTGCLVPLRTSLFEGPARERTTFVPIHEQAHLPALLLGDDPPLDGPGTPPAPAVAEEVVIAQGCTSGCSYCFSRLARGSLRSVPAEELAARVRAAVGRGAREVRLTGLDTAAWGLDLPGAPRLPDLLRSLERLDGDFRLRVGMMSPQTLAPILDEYARALSGARVFRFVHLPVQSGSDRLLAAMHRGYAVDEFRREVGTLRAAHPDLFLSTDVIVGFPGETPAEHEATERLLEEIAPETVNVTRFSARPGTVAARLPPVSPRVAKARSRSVAALRMRVARRRLERWIGTFARARISERGAGSTSVARLPNYLPVVLPEERPLGSEVEVRIDGARSTYLLGRVVPGGPGRPDVARPF